MLLDSATAFRAAGRDLREHLDACLKARSRRFRKFLDRCRKHPSQKSVHQLRVEARRLMAVLSVLHFIIPGAELDALQCEIRAIFRSAARLRNNHVRALLLEEEAENF